MKTLCCFILSLTLLATARGAVTVAWDRNAEPEVSSYVVFSGGTSRVYTNSFVTTNLVFTFTNLPLGTNYFAVKARAVVNGQSIESDFSLEVSTLVKPGAPVNVRLSLLSSDDPNGPWLEMSGVFASVHLDSPKQFYRGLMAIER